MVLSMCWRRSVTASRGCAMSLPTVDMQATNCEIPWPAWGHGPLRSSSGPIPPKVSRFCPAAGSSNAHSHGSVGAVDWQRTGKLPSPPQPSGPSSLPSACSAEERQAIVLLDQLSNRALTRAFGACVLDTDTRDLVVDCIVAAVFPFSRRAETSPVCGRSVFRGEWRFAVSGSSACRFHEQGMGEPELVLPGAA